VAIGWKELIGKVGLCGGNQDGELLVRIPELQKQGSRCGLVRMFWSITGLYQDLPAPLLMEDHPCAREMTAADGDKGLANQRVQRPPTL
jgi:hypothetical protein